MRVKIFSVNNPWGSKRQNEQTFEQEINQWLADNGQVEIIRIEQSASGGSFGPSMWMISIWYDQH